MRPGECIPWNWRWWLSFAVHCTLCYCSLLHMYLCSSLLLWWLCTLYTSLLHTTFVTVAVTVYTVHQSFTHDICYCCGDCVHCTPVLYTWHLLLLRWLCTLYTSLFHTTFVTVAVTVYTVLQSFTHDIHYCCGDCVHCTPVFYTRHSLLLRWLCTLYSSLLHTTFVTVAVTVYTVRQSFTHDIRYCCGDCVHCTTPVFYTRHSLLLRWLCTLYYASLLDTTFVTVAVTVYTVTRQSFTHDIRYCCGDCVHCTTPVFYTRHSLLLRW